MHNPSQPITDQVFAPSVCVFHCCAWWHQQELWLLLMDEGGYCGEDLGYAVGKEQQTIQRPLLTWPLTCSTTLPLSLTHADVHFLTQSKTSHQSFPGRAFMTQMVGILHGLWNTRFISLCTASNSIGTLTPVDFLALPEKANAFLKIWAAVNPS